ncbi:MAG: peptidase [Bacteroidetes bacterium]|nr:MAG: peptidase [Bacteroidota bacterium]
MNRILIFLLALFAVSGCTSKADRTIGEINILLDSLQIQYAPDTRIALWDFTLSGAEGVVVLSGEVDQKSAYKAVVKAIDQNFPEVDNQLVLLPENGDGNLVNGLVNNSVANFRAGRSSRTELVTQALLGSPVRILKEEEGWYLVQISNSYLGWVNKSEVRPLERTRLDSFRMAQKVFFNRQYGVSYSEPDEASMPVSDLVIGCMLPVAGSESGFYKVWYPDGREAWVKQSEVVLATHIFNKSLSGEGMVEAVLKFNGIPYLWGGASSKAIDCSGLTSNVFFMNGALLPRDADQQSFCGREITTEYVSEDLVPGDLLFFGRRATDTRPESVTHVAFYIGDSEFIHAAGYRDRVSINSIDSARDNYISTYPEIFIRSVRFIGEEGTGFESITENRFYKEIINTTE